MAVVYMKKLELEPLSYENGFTKLTKGINLEIQDWILNKINQKHNVLDFGCGPGTLAIKIAQKGCTVTGIDHNPNMVSVAQKSLLLYSNLKINFEEGSAVNTMYSNIFDVTTGDMYLFWFHQFNEVVHFNLAAELAKGRHSYRISDLFTQELVDTGFDEYYDFPAIIRVIPMDILLLLVTLLLDVILVVAFGVVISRKVYQAQTI